MSVSRTKNPRVVTTRTLTTMKRMGEKIAMLTAYDYLVAKYLDQVGIDIILVGDSVGNVVQGHETTLPVTVDDMIYHAKAVKRAVKTGDVLKSSILIAEGLRAGEQVVTSGASFLYDGAPIEVAPALVTK